MRFKAREIPVARSRDYMAFVRAVRADEGQSINLESTVAGAPVIPASAQPEELYGAALAALRNDNPAQAIELLRRVTDVDPKHKQVWNTLGFAYYSAQNFEEAVKAFQQQIDGNPYDENAYRNLGLVYQRQQKFAEAVEALKKQLEVKPLDRAAQAMLGVVYREWKKYEEAAAELEKAISLDPENAALHVNLGQAYLNLKDNDKAIAAFDKAVELEPSPTVWNNVAYELSLNRVQLERARQYAESAVAATAAELRNVELSRVTMSDMRKVSALASYWDTLGWIHFQNGDLDKAEQYCRASWLLDFHGEVGDHLGQIREKRGDKAGALNSYWQAATGTRPIPETRERIERLAADKAVAQQASRDRRTVQELRSVSLGPLLQENASAEFLLMVEPGPQGAMQVTATRFVSGSEKLRPLESHLRSLKFEGTFPDETQTRLPRRGVLSCSAASGAGCTFVVYAADGVTSVD
jgi:tetratricopeptide (TPR) repeat protein